jgi:hypothetical protein
MLQRGRIDGATRQQHYAERGNGSHLVGHSQMSADERKRAAEDRV